MSHVFKFECSICDKVYYTGDLNGLQKAWTNHKATHHWLRRLWHRMFNRSISRIRSV